MDCFVHSFPLRVTKVVENVHGRLDGVIIFSISVPSYDVASYRLHLEVSDDMIVNVLATCIGSRAIRKCWHSCLLLLCSSFSVEKRSGCAARLVQFIFTEFSISPCIDEDDFGSDAYSSIRFQSTEVKF